MSKYWNSEVEKEDRFVINMKQMKIISTFLEEKDDQIINELI